MAMRRLSLTISPVLRFVDWLFGPAASGADLAFLLLETWWLCLMLFRPGIFDQPPLVGMTWAPDAFWIAFVSVVALAHLCALARPAGLRVRMAATSASAWYWLTIAASVSRAGPTTGSGTYLMLGLGAAALAVYVSGRDQHRG